VVTFEEVLTVLMGALKVPDDVEVVLDAAAS
jgi:hypothetical protein